MQTTTVPTTHDHDDYAPFLEAFRGHFATAAGNGPLFTTGAMDLFNAFLGALPAEHRQHHTCHACRHFVERFGGLVTIDGDGRTTPVMWGPAPGMYGPAMEAAGRIVRKARVTGVFLAAEKAWGQPATGKWHHMAVHPAATLLSRSRVPSQDAALKSEEYGMLQRGLAEFSPEAVKQALTICKAEALYRSEKVLGVARWLDDLHTRRAAVKGTARDNLAWLAVATAPTGYCHVKASMIGTLLEDIAAGLPLESVKTRFAEKMHPLQYQRPQAPPSAGSIAQAEKLFAEQGLAPALRRRYARLEEVIPHALWTPAPPKEKAPAGGVFGHLVPKGSKVAPAALIPAATMTWAKFRDTVLPDAVKMEYHVPRDAAPFLALVTAADPDAPPIIQWDRPERRNPASWYLYHGGSRAARWNLVPGEWVPVTALTLFPHQWDPERSYSHHGEGVVVVLDGCRDVQGPRSAAIFPEMLRGALHGVRAVIEAYSRSATIEGKEEATACGMDLHKGGAWQHGELRVTAKDGTVVIYRLDRWD